MQQRTPDEQNADARAKREQKIAALKGLSRVQEEKTYVSLEETLAAFDPNSTRDDDLDYSGYRISKRANVEIKLNVSVSQQQEQQQQQQQQQQMQVAQNQQSHDLSQKKYERYQGYRNLISIQHRDHGDKTDKEELKKLTDQYPSLAYKLKNLAGYHDSETGGIGYVTIEAAKVIAENLRHFESGVVLDYLPDGFCVSATEGEQHLPLPPAPAAKVDQFGQVIKQHTYDKREYSRLVLDYKKQIKNQKHPLTLNLTKPSEPIKIEGTPAQFNVEGGAELFAYFKRRTTSAWHYNRAEDEKTQITRRETLFKFMQGDSKTHADKTIADKLINKYAKLFGLFSPNEIAGLWDIFYSAGCDGLQIILEKFQAIINIDNGRTFENIRNSFLCTSPNWMEFLEDNALIVFDKIIELTPNQRTWWERMSFQHIQYCGWTDLNDLFSAFEFFCNEYRLIGVEKCGEAEFIELPANYSLYEAKNMKIAIARLLVVMRNARNFQEQANNLRFVNFNSNDVFYASVHQQYSLITTAMNVEESKTVEAANRTRENKDPDSDMRLTYDEMLGMLETVRIFPFLHKYLGIQPYSAPYAEYVEMIDMLMYPRERTINNLYATQRNQLAFILTATTTNKRGYQCNIKHQLAVLQSYLANYSGKVNEVLKQMVALMSAARWLGLPELVMVAKLLFQISGEQPKFLHDFVVDQKEEFTAHLAIYDKNKHALEPKTYISCLFILKEEKDEEQLRVKLPRIFSIIHKNNFNLNDVKVLISLLKKFEIQNGKHAYNELVDILSIMKLKDESAPPPDMQDVLSAIRKFGKIKGASVKQYIAQGLPTNCTYDPVDCRSVIVPPIGTPAVLAGFKRAARTYGIGLNEDERAQLDGKNDALSFIVLISKKYGEEEQTDEPVGEEKVDSTLPTEATNSSENQDKPKPWRQIAEEFVLQLQKEQLREHEGKIALENVNDKRILNEIILSIFPPGPFKKIEDSLVPMKEYSDQVAVFIQALIGIQKKWPQDLSDLLSQICSDPTETKVRRSLKFLNDFLYQITETFSGKLPFPSDIFKMLMIHEKKYGANLKLLAVDRIFGAKNVTLTHKMQLLRLNLDAASKEVDATDFIQGLLSYHDQFAPIFSLLLSIIEKYTDQRDMRFIFSFTLSLLKLLSEINDEKFTETLFTLLAKNPESYLSIVHKIVTIPVPVEKMAPIIPLNELPALEAPKALAESSGSKTPTNPEEAHAKSPTSQTLDAKQESPSPKHLDETLANTAPIQKKINAREIITKLIFQCCDSSEFNEPEILQAINTLSKEKNATLQALIEMRPSPTFKTLKIVLERNSCRHFIENPTHPLYCYRMLEEQFETSRAVSAIEELKDLTNGKKLFFSQRCQLLQQFLLVNRFGHHTNSPIYSRDVPGGKLDLTAKDLTDPELQELVTKCRAVFKDETSSSTDKENARLVFIALVRETMWRITRKFPYSTQMISVLNAALHKGSLLSEIDTGEGKGMIMAMLAANLWFEGKAVNVCTSNLELARVAFEEFAPVFDLLGIPRSGKIITSKTSVTEYCYDGINYSDTAQLSLFIAKQKLDPDHMKYHQNDPLSLALDEADFTFFDDTTHYRYATTLHQTDLSWVFQLLYQFIRSPEFKSDNATIEQDIVNAKRLLKSAAQELQKDVAYIEKLSDRQIDTWLESAIAASKLKEGKEFIVRSEGRGLGEDSYYVSFARILANSRVSEGAEWSNGVHQFLHARLNEERDTKQRRIPAFPLDPETAPIASMSSKNVMEHHLERGRVLCVTGTAGSKDELRELAEQGIAASRIPPHKTNQRVTEAPVLANGEEDHFAKIMDSIVRHLRQNESFSIWGFQADEKPQPILVAFNDIEKSQRFYDYLTKELSSPRLARYKSLLNSQLLNGSKSIVNGKDSPVPEDEVVSKAGVAGWITVSTLLDRGTDIKPRLKDDDVKQNHPNGLYVLQTFVASERLTRQIEGRAARLGHIGQSQLIVDQTEFAELMTADQMSLGIEAVKLLQDNRAVSEKSKRRFAERLGAIKNYFFMKYISFMQDEKNMTPDLNRKWAACLNNMDIEWQRLVTKFRQGKLNERTVLERCTTSLVFNASKDWNFLVPDDGRFLVQPQLAEKIITQQKNSKAEEKIATEVDALNLPLDINDVSPARYCIEHSPLYFTILNKDQDYQKERAELKKRIDKKKLGAAQECIKQIFGKDAPTKMYADYLREAFANLIAEAYSESHHVPFRKKLLEIFAIGQWSENAVLQADLSRTFLESIYKFAVMKLSEYKKELPAIPLSINKQAHLSKEANTIVALLDSLRHTLATRLAQKHAEKAQMNAIEAVVDTTIDSVSAYFYEASPVMLQKLIDMIDHPFTRDQVALNEALKVAETTHTFLTSWCVLFRQAAPDAEPVKVEHKQEQSAGYVFV